LKPKQPFVDWLDGFPEGSEQHETKHTIGETDSFLVSVSNTDEGLEQYLRTNFRRLFEQVLYEWCTDPTRWPASRDYQTFCLWFECESHSLVLDAVEEGNPGLNSQR
jgi:hypothetical protein